MFVGFEPGTSRVISSHSTDYATGCTPGSVAGRVIAYHSRDPGIEYHEFMKFNSEFINVEFYLSQDEINLSQVVNKDDLVHINHGWVLIMKQAPSQNNLIQSMSIYF